MTWFLWLLLAAGAGAVAVLAFLRRTHRTHPLIEHFVGLAAELGAKCELEDGRPRLTGTDQGATVELGMLAGALRAVYRGAQPHVHLEVYPHGGRDNASVLRGMDDVTVGAEQFDKEFVVKCEDEVAAGSLLTPLTRGLIERLRAVSDVADVFVSLDRSQLTVIKPVNQQTLGDHQLHEFVELVGQLYHAMADAAAQDPGLSGELATACQVCGEPLEQDLVSCRRCRTLHHRDCWRYYGACSTYGCGEKRYVPGTGRRRTTLVIDERTTAAPRVQAPETRPTPAAERGERRSGRSRADERSRGDGRSRRRAGRRRRRDRQRESRRRSREASSHVRERARRSHSRERDEDDDDRPEVRRRTGLLPLAKFGPWTCSCGCLLAPFLMMAVLVVAQALWSLLPHVARRKAAARETRARIVELGGTIDTAGAEIDGHILLSDRPATDDDIQHIDLFSGALDQVDLSGTLITDQSADPIGKLQYLTQLDLSRTAIGDQGLRAMQPLIRLRTLGMAGTRITDDGLASLQKKVWLRELDLSDTQISDKGLASLAPLLELQSLKLAGTSVYGPGLRHLRADRLQTLDLSDTPLDDRGLDGLRALLSRQKRQLDVLVHNTDVTQTGIDGLREQFPLLRAEPRVVPPQGGGENLAGQARVRAVFVGGGAPVPATDQSLVKFAVDGDPQTAWLCRDKSGGVTGRPFLELKWPRTVTVHRIVLRQRHDRLLYVTMPAFLNDPDQRFPIVSFNAETRQLFFFGSTAGNQLLVDRKPLSRLAQRQFGARPHSGQLVVFDFSFQPRKIDRLTLWIRRATRHPVEIAEWEVYGSETAE